jgi:hypothetical protein
MKDPRNLKEHLDNIGDIYDRNLIWILEIKTDVPNTQLVRWLHGKPLPKKNHHGIIIDLSKKIDMVRIEIEKQRRSVESFMNFFRTTLGIDKTPRLGMDGKTEDYWDYYEILEHFMDKDK